MPTSSVDPSEQNEQSDCPDWDERDWEDYNYDPRAAGGAGGLGRDSLAASLANLLDGLPGLDADEIAAMIRDLPMPNDASNLVPGSDGKHLRTYTTLQWESDDYIGRPKERCYPFDLDGHCFRGKNPQVMILYIMVYTMIYIITYHMLYTMVYIMVYSMCIYFLCTLCTKNMTYAIV